MRITLEHIEDITADIKTFWFRPEQPVHYSAGQFTTVHLPHPNADDRGETRWFTLSSSPTEPLVSITTKQALERGSTFKQALFALRPGDTVEAAAPLGDFVLPKDPTIPIIFIAGGLGITPIRSMTKYMLDTNEHRSIHLTYTARSHKDLAFTELFSTYYNDNYETITGEDEPLTPDHILALLSKTPGALVYLSGPESLIETFARSLKAAGVDPYQIITDYFPGYSEL